MSDLNNIPGLRYEMTLRCDRPLHGCEITPSAHCYLRGGATDNATRAKIMEANPHYFTYHWARGKQNARIYGMCPPSLAVWVYVHLDVIARHARLQGQSCAGWYALRGLAGRHY